MLIRLKIINTTDLLTKDNNFNLFIASNVIGFNISSGLGDSQILLKMNAKIFLPQNSQKMFLAKRFRAPIGFFRAMVLQAVKGYFLEIIFFGINYNFKKKRIKERFKSFRNLHRLVNLELHFAKKLRLKMPAGMYFRVFKRRLIVFSFLRQKLINFYNLLKRFRKANPYTGKGIRVRRRTIQYKIGKKRIK